MVMVNAIITKLALALTSKEEREAFTCAMVHMEEEGIPVVHFNDIKSHETACPEAEEVTKQSTALILLSEEN